MRNMRNLSLFVLGLIAFTSCSSDGGGGTKEPANSAPTTPSLTYPSNNLVCIDNAVNFQWNASTDAQADAVRYEIQIATDNAFTQGLSTAITNATSKQITLVKGKSYFWRVRATDNKNASSEYSSVYNFYTEGDGVINHVPFAPVLVSPSLQSTQTTASVSLNWTASDADASDVLKYDVYFGTTNPPTTKVASDLAAKTYTAAASAAGTYYWRIVVKDDKGASSVGQVWFFNKQ